MANDLINRPDWSLGAPVSGASTIAGSGFFNETRVTDVAAYRESVGVQAAQAVEAGLSEQQRSELNASLAELPETIREAFRQELQMGTTGACRAATEAEIARLSADEAGARLVREARGRAARIVGIVNMRFKRILKNINSPADREIAADWFEYLDADEAYSVLKELGR